MYINEKMSKNVVSVKADSTVSKAYGIMTEAKHSKLPVVDDDNKLVGIITDRIIEEVNPDKATSLSEYEINHLLSKIKVREIMNTGVFKIRENACIEEAALILKENKISFLPVVNNNNQVVGITGRTDIFKAFLDMLGVKNQGARITVKTNNISNVVDIVVSENIEILSLINNNEEITLKLASLEVDKLVSKLNDGGFEVLAVVKQH